MFKVHGPVLAGLNPEASDEELLDFAEHCEDEILQLAVISYVEILIEMEGCESLWRTPSEGQTPQNRT